MTAVRCGFLNQDDIIDIYRVLAAPEVIVPAIAQYPVQPGLDCFGVAQLATVFQSLGQCFLNQIVRQSRVVAPGIGDAIQVATVFSQVAPELLVFAQSRNHIHTNINSP